MGIKASNFPFIRKPPPPKPEDRDPRVVFQPAVYERLLAGIEQLVAAVRPTLGPRPRYVAVDRGLPGKRPELMDDAGLIARRIVALADREADMGAMLVRNLLWRQHERHGDGTATAAVLFQAVFKLGVKHMAAGGNAMRLRGYLEAGLAVIMAELARQVTPVSGQAALTRLAGTLGPDAALATVLGEVLDVIGEFGQLEILEARGRELEREYFDGSYWKGGLLLNADPGGPPQKVTLRNAALLISDVDADDPQQVAIVIEMARKRGAQGLLLIVSKLSDPVRALLLTANKSLKDFQISAAQTPSASADEQVAALEDLALLTGGRPLARAAGQTLGSVRASDLGLARTAWADRLNVGLIGGQGNPRVTRQHLAALRAAHAAATDKDAKARLGARIGRLGAGAATLWVGAATEAELAARKTLAERTVAALRGALLEGTLPGGGAALLACAPALQAKLKAATDPDEQAAYRILLQASEAPLRTIVANTGGEPSPVVAAVRAAQPGWGYDARTEQIVDLAAAGIVDVATTQRAAIHGAIAAAALALTVDVLIEHRAPTTSVNP